MRVTPNSGSAASTPARNSGSHPEDTNYKNQLNALCQRMTGESMGKTDILYDTKVQGGGYQSTVTVVCLGNETAAGEVTQTAKEAEQSAAMFCLVVLQAKLNTLGQSLDKPPQKIPPAVEAAAMSIDIDTSEGITDISMRAMLHETTKQAQGRAVDKGDINIVYADGLQTGTFVCQLTLPNVPGVTGFTTFVGWESAFKRDTCVNAYMQALDSMLSDPDIGSKIDLTGKIQIKNMRDKKIAERQSKAAKALSNPELASKGKGKGGGKGKAKGKGKGKECKGGSGWEQEMVKQVMSMDSEQLLLMAQAMEEINSIGKAKGKGSNSSGSRAGPYW